MTQVGGVSQNPEAAGTESGTQQATTTISDDDLGDDVQLAFTLSVSDLFGNPLPNDQVEIGQSFRLNAFVQDVRPNPTGVFAGYLDVAYDSPHRFSVISSEQQRLILSHDVTGGIYELTFQGVSTGPIALGATLEAATNNLQQALESHPQIGAGNVRVVNMSILDFTAGPSSMNTFAFDISFVNDLAEIDLPTLVVDASLLTRASGQPTASVQVIADADPARSDPEWFRNAFMGGPIYNSFRGIIADGDKNPATGQVLDPNVFSEVGFGTSASTPIPGTEGNRELLWSVDLHADTTGSIHFTGSPADNFPHSDLVVFGRNVAVPVDKATYGAVSVEIVDPGNSPIQLLAGETRVTNESGTIFVRHNGNVLFQQPRTEATELHFLGGDGDEILAVGDLGLHNGQAIDLTFDGQGGIDTFRLFEASQMLDLTTLADGALQNVEIIDVSSSGSTLKLSLAVVQQISPNNPLRVHSDESETIEIGTGWKVELPQIADDGQFVHVLHQGESTIHVVNDRAWQNPLDPLDANRDGSVSPLDALVGINTLNTLGPRELLAPTSVVGAAQFFYFDSSGDRSVSPLDVLLVINFLNDPRSSSEAEATPFTLPSDSPGNATFFSAGDRTTTFLHPALVTKDSRDYIFAAIATATTADDERYFVPHSVHDPGVVQRLLWPTRSVERDEGELDSALESLIDDLANELTSKRD